MLGLLNDHERQKDSILVLDPDPKKKNDRTWCYWEEGTGLYDDIVYKEWPQGKFISKTNSVELGMGDYRYKMIRAIDFYEYAREKAKTADNITWLEEKVETVSKTNEVRTSSNSFKGDFVYDSRITDDFKSDIKSVTIAQHFLGWVIRAEEPVFNPQSFTMMDYRENQPENCSFTYILPFDEHTALVEITFFSEEVLTKQDYVTLLKNYIDKVLKTNYEILEEEAGVIPMTNFPFARGNRNVYLKIGTGGGWVKPSTGYSFRNSQRYVEKVLDNLRSGNPPAKKLISARHRFLDTIFIKVLRNHNASGEMLFDRMYTGLPARTVFRFLDEQSTLLEDLRIMLLYPDIRFIRSFFSALKSKIL